jgi:hypothetical protein
VVEKSKACADIVGAWVGAAKLHEYGTLLNTWARAEGMWPDAGIWT